MPTSNYSMRRGERALRPLPDSTERVERAGERADRSRDPCEPADRAPERWVRADGWLAWRAGAGAWVRAAGREELCGAVGLAEARREDSARWAGLVAGARDGAAGAEADRPARCAGCPDGRTRPSDRAWGRGTGADVDRFGVEIAARASGCVRALLVRAEPRLLSVLPAAGRAASCAERSGLAAVPRVRAAGRASEALWLERADPVAREAAARCSTERVAAG